MILNYQTQIQLLDDWCWAAVTSSVAMRYNNGSPWTQGALAGALLDGSCSVIDQTNAGNAPTVCHKQFDLQTALTQTKNFAWALPRPLTLNEVIDQINHGFPICCQIYWQAYKQSHYVTIYGYNGGDVVIGDPDSGACSLDHTAMVTSGYRTGQWIQTLGTQPSS
jgi:hypothetical protein